MVDMSHYSKEENLEKTTKWVKYCRDRGIATEAEPGRMTGGEDGVKATDADMEGVLTSPEEAGKFVDTGIQFLAPAFGNLHGEYGGVENMKLDFDRSVLLPMEVSVHIDDANYVGEKVGFIKTYRRKGFCPFGPTWHEWVSSRTSFSLCGTWDDET